MPFLGLAQNLPVNYNYYENVPDNFPQYFGEVDSIFLLHSVHKITTYYKEQESDTLRKLKMQYYEKGKRTKDELYELSTGKLERVIHYMHLPGKLIVDMVHYPSVENGYRLPARRFRYLLNEAFVFPYQPDSQGVVKVRLQFTWQSNGDILYEGFDYLGKQITKQVIQLKQNALKTLQRAKPAYPRIVKKEVDSYHLEEFHYNKWGKLSLYKGCSLRDAYGIVDQFDYDDKGLLIREQRFTESPGGRKMTAEYVFAHQ
jgi:hypothetical protein